MLDSDINSPDSRLAVRFFQREVKNNFRSEAEGRPIFDMRDYIRIEIPGDRNSIIETFVNDDHKRRFPMQWAQFLNEKAEGKLSGDVQGTLLRDWPILTSAQAQELKHYKFYTVEQIASAGDDHISKIGMLAGMSPFSLREKARAFLANAKDSAVVQQQAEALRERDEELRQLKEQVAQLLAAQEPKKPGRPPKEKD